MSILSRRDPVRTDPVRADGRNGEGTQWLTLANAGLALAFLVLAGFAGFLAYVVVTYEPDTLVTSRIERFTLAEVHPPKHFSVTLRDASGTLLDRLSVSKHCNTWRQLKIGQDLDLEIATYRKPPNRGGTTYEKILTGGNRICPAPLAADKP